MTAECVLDKILGSAGVGLTSVDVQLQFMDAMEFGQRPQEVIQKILGEVNAELVSEEEAFILAQELVQMWNELALRRNRAVQALHRRGWQNN